MRLYIDRLTQKIVASPGSKDPITSIGLKRGDSARIEVVFFEGLTVVELAGTEITGQIGFKEQGKYDGAYLANDLAWSKEGSGTSTVYVFTPDLNTVELNALLFHGDADDTNDVASVTLMGEITWDIDGAIYSTQEFEVVVANDVNKGDEGTPTGASGDPDGYVADRALCYDRAQSLSASEKTQALVNLGLPGKHNYAASGAPTVDDDTTEGYSVGSLWIDTTADEAYRCADATEGAAVWIESTFDAAEVTALLASALADLVDGTFEVIGDASSIKLNADTTLPFISGSVGGSSGFRRFSVADEDLPAIRDYIHFDQGGGSWLNFAITSIIASGVPGTSYIYYDDPGETVPLGVATVAIDHQSGDPELAFPTGYTVPQSISCGNVTLIPPYTSGFIARTSQPDGSMTAADVDLAVIDQQVELVSQAANTADSAMTRGLSDTRYGGPMLFPSGTAAHKETSAETPVYSVSLEPGTYHFNAKLFVNHTEAGALTANVQMGVSGGTASTKLRFLRAQPHQQGAGTAAVYRTGASSSSWASAITNGSPSFGVGMFELSCVVEVTATTTFAVYGYASSLPSNNVTYELTGMLKAQ